MKGGYDWKESVDHKLTVGLKRVFIQEEVIED
jgi:hypothetical protein